MKNRYKILLLIVVIFLIGFGFILIIDRKVEIKTIKLLNYDANTNKIIIEIEKKKNIIPFNYKCIVKTDDESIIVKSINNSCKIDLKIPNDYKIEIKSVYNKSKEYNLLDYIDNRLDFKFLVDNIYLIKGEQEKIKYSGNNIVNDNYSFYVENDKIAMIDENGNIIGLSNGSTVLHERNSDEKVNVIVTDLITLPLIPNERKSLLPCNIYNDEENKLLDFFLQKDVEEAGYGTRAGVVAAARFLTLKFKYRIPYFFENGRVSDSGVNYVDGEGRYYHTGLYISDMKKKDIISSFSGPSIWGCPLRNWENEPYFGYFEGNMMPNGLDCSGFVTWSLVNGGFNPGDNGAGQMTELGEYVPLSRELLDSKVIKAGDLFNFWGHISIIVGIKDDIYYVAESLPNFDGVDLRIYNKEEAMNMFTHVVLMDSYYMNAGNYTEYWD